MAKKLDNWDIKILALAAAILLWLYVQYLAK